MENIYNFKNGEECGYCFDGTVSKTIDFAFTKARLGCELCGGSGNLLVSGSNDTFVDCECMTGHGHKICSLKCSACGFTEPLTE